MRALFMINARARSGAQHGEEVRAALEAAGWEVFTESLEGRSAAEIMKTYRDRIDIGIVGGGDGTLMAALPAFVNGNIPLGIIPLGTFNDLAGALQIPAQPAAAVETILSGRRRPIDVGAVNGRYFLTEASIGISTQIARRQTTDVKRSLGIFSALTTTATTIWRARPFSVSVAHDGVLERFRTIQLTVANSFHFGGLITNRTAALDDGKLELYSLTIERWTDALPLIKPILRQEVRNSSAVQTRRSAKFEVRTRRRRHVFADGEPAAMTPATFEVVPRAITVCVPPQDEAA